MGRYGGDVLDVGSDNTSKNSQFAPKNRPQFAPEANVTRLDFHHQFPAFAVEFRGCTDWVRSSPIGPSSRSKDSSLVEHMGLTQPF